MFVHFGMWAAWCVVGAVPVLAFVRASVLVCKAALGAAAHVGVPIATKKKRSVLVSTVECVG